MDKPLFWISLTKMVIFNIALLVLEGKMMIDCVFCKIIKGEIDSSIVYKDEICTAFLDIQPVNPGHVLIVPNKHVKLVCDLDDKTASHIFIVAKKINKALRDSTIKCEGINYFLADGEEAFQEVFHTHLHCFPRYKNDGFKLQFAETYFKKPSRDILNEIAKEIKRHL